MTEDTIRLKLAIASEEAVTAAARTETLKAKQDLLGRALDEGVIKGDRYNQLMAKSSAELAKAESAAARAAALTEKLTVAQNANAAAAEKAAKSTGGTVNAIQGTSRAVQDFTSSALNGGFVQGLNSITNNVDQMAQGFGRMGGMTAQAATNLGSIATFGVVGLQLAIVALTPIIKGLLDQFGLFKGAVDPAATEVERLKTKIKELGDKPIKLQVDRNELAAAEADLKRLTAAREAYNRIAGLKSEDEKESEASVTKVFGQDHMALGSLAKPEIAKAEAGARAAQAEKVAKLEKELADLVKAGYRPWELTEAKQAIEDAKNDTKPVAAAIATAKDRVGTLVGGATGAAKPGQVGDANEALAQAAEKAGRHDIAFKVRMASPTGRAESNTANDEMERQNEDLAVDQRLRDKTREENEKAQEELDKQEDEKIEKGGKALSKQSKDARETQKHVSKDATNELKKMQADAQANAKLTAAGGTMDEEIGAFLNIQDQRRHSLDGVTGATRKRMIAEAAKAGTPILTAEEANAQAEQAAMNAMSSTTMRDKDGNELNAEQRRAAAKAMVGDANADLSRRQMELQGQGLNQAERGVAITDQLIGLIDQVGQRTLRLEQGMNRNAQRAQQVSRSNLRQRGGN
jgi:hypothetical protein